MNDVLSLIDEIEQLVENGKLGFMGKRFINEEDFFILMQRLRATVAQNGATRGTTKAVQEFIEESRLLTNQEQLQIVAALANRLAEKQP